MVAGEHADAEFGQDGLEREEQEEDGYQGKNQERRQETPLKCHI